MPVQKITIDDFLQLAANHPVLDVRSPSEYWHAQIPGAYSFPLFTDEERKQVGTTYKQQSREEAIKLGLDFFGPRMKAIVEEAEKIAGEQEGAGKTLLVHCWRGGMRSAAIAWLLDLYGFKIYTLVGGYKSYRRWVLEQFEKSYLMNVLGGNTGSGKTELLHELGNKGYTIIDLEALANHKGSAFGAIGQSQQPSQEMFENRLATALWNLQVQNENRAIFIEDESQRIGDINIPMAFWKQMRNTRVFFLDVPFEERLEYIIRDYGKGDKEKLANAIIRIQKRLGGLETKTALNFLLEDNFRESFRILLQYYDKWYAKGLQNRENLGRWLNKIPCLSVDTEVNTQNLLSCYQEPALLS